MDIIRRRGYGRTLDYSAEEQSRKYFEGTGSLVIDRINGVAYVALSERANKDLAERWAADMGYRVNIHLLFFLYPCLVTMHVQLHHASCD